MAIDPAKIDHGELALSRLATQFTEATNLKAYILALLVESNNIEENLFDLIENRYLATAYGVQLDILGEIVGQDRSIVDSAVIDYFGLANNPQANPFGSIGDVDGGRFRGVNESIFGNRELTDAEYRRYILMKIINNTTTSTPEEIIFMFGFLFGSDTLIILTEGPGTKYAVQIGKELSSDDRAFLLGFVVPKTAGVSVSYTVMFGPTPFAFIGVPGAGGFNTGKFGQLI